MKKIVVALSVVALVAGVVALPAVASAYCGGNGYYMNTDRAQNMDHYVGDGHNHDVEHYAGDGHNVDCPYANNNGGQGRGRHGGGRHH